MAWACQHVMTRKKKKGLRSRVSDLEMALGLHEAPHDPKGAEEVPVGVGCQARDDGVVGSLVGGDTVGVFLIQYEVVTSVL